MVNKKDLTKELFADALLKREDENIIERPRKNFYHLLYSYFR